MNQILKLTIPVLLLLVLCTTLSGASAQQVAINAEDGDDLPATIPVGETFTVRITEGGSPVPAGTNVVFTLPVVGGDPIYVPTDSDGKARYKPLLTGTLGIKALDGLDMVAEATVTVAEGVSEPPALASVDISPEAADLVIGGTQPFTAVCKDTNGDPISECTRTWSSDRTLVGTINSTGFFTAAGVGTATVTVTATYNGVTKTDAAIVSVSGSIEQIPVAGDNFTEPPIDAGTAVINMSGWFDNDVTGSINITVVPNPEAAAGYAFTGDGQTLIGLNVTPNATIRDELANGGDTIRIEICYDVAELESLNIDPATLAIWRYDGSAWVKMVKDTPPCVDNGGYGTCVWVKLDNLSIFALVGTLKSQPGDGTGSGSGTYPPGWGAPAPTPAATPAPTAAPEPTVAQTEAPTVAPTDAPTKAPTAAPTEIATTKVETKGTPGFGAVLTVFAIAGLLVATYLVMRRRE